MKPEEQYLTFNKESWNKRVHTHFDSEFYNVKDFLKGKTSLNSIELDLRGNITGRKSCIYNAILVRIPFHFHEWVLKLPE